MGVMFSFFVVVQLLNYAASELEVDDLVLQILHMTFFRILERILQFLQSACC